MKKYRKRPIVVEAAPLNEDNLEELAAWCEGSVRGVQLHKSERVIKINTLEGDMRASVGDWIIKGVNGEFYPCKPDIFLKTYEPVADPGFATPKEFK